MAGREPTRVVIRALAPSGDADTVTARDLDDWSTAVARLLADKGVRQCDRVVSTLGNTAEHFAAAFATWKLGACFVPLNPRSPERELDELVALAEPAACLGDGFQAPTVVDRRTLAACRAVAGPALPPVVADPGLAIASGGSTGRPKLIVTPGPWGGLPVDFLSRSGFRPGQRQLVVGPVHHNGPFVMSYYGLLMGHELVVMPGFDAARALDAIETYAVQAVFVVPTTMRRLLEEWRRAPRDLTSVETVLHSAAPCPLWLKRAWIELVGPAHLYEGYGASEGVGGALIRGDEWLAHPGSVGRPYCDVRIVGSDGRDVPTGEVGDVYLRRHDDGTPTFAYLGSAEPERTPDGFVSVGDLGWLSDDGYLFIADRRDDLIISGGVNVYPAEVEAVLSEHPEVADVAVIGLPDPEWGTRVHALVEPRDPTTPPGLDDLVGHCRARLAPYKVPKSLEVVAVVPRSEAGKMRRSALVPRQSG